MKELSVTDLKIKEKYKGEYCKSTAGMTNYGQRAKSGLRYSGTMKNVALY
jgi:hypothetical protein